MLILIFNIYTSEPPEVEMFIRSGVSSRKANDVSMPKQSVNLIGHVPGW